MDLAPFYLSLASLVVGWGLSFLTTAATTHEKNKREDARENRENDRRLLETGRHHAASALTIVRAAQSESWKRDPDKMSWDLDLADLKLDVAAAEIDLIPDAILRPRLASVIGMVRFPHTLSNSSYTEGPPVGSQRKGLWLAREALARYIREESTPESPDALGELARDIDAAHEEREEFYASIESKEESASAPTSTPKAGRFARIRSRFRRTA